MTGLAPGARVVVVGAGQGGFQVAASLREAGFEGSLTLVGDEPGLPYQRPPLSKAYMAHGEAERLHLKPAAFYERAAVAHVTARAVALDRAARQVTTADGASHGYDHLVLATGARATRPPLPGFASPRVLELRTLADADRLRARMAAARHAVVIGGGFIGLEFAAMARAAGLAVTLVETAPRLMARAVSPALSAWFLDAHRAMGVDVLLGAAVAEIPLEGDTPAGVTLADGRFVAGDLLLCATGVRPNVELAEAAGLDVANGIVVDACLATADPAVSALGDCAAFPLPDGRMVRLESVQAAVDHARHIARRLTAGATAPYAAVPWFWSDQGPHKLQIAGLGTGAEETVVPPVEEGRATVLAFREGRLAAVETVGLPAQHMAARKLIGTPRAMLEAAGYDLREAFRSSGCEPRAAAVA